MRVSGRTRIAGDARAAPVGLGLVIWLVPCLILLFGSDYRQVPVVQTAGKCPIGQLTDLQAQAMLRYFVARHNDGLTDLKAIEHTCRTLGTCLAALADPSAAIRLLSIPNLESRRRRRRRRKRLGRQHDQQQANCTSVGWSALVQWGLLSGEERGEVVEGGGPPGFGVVAAGGVGSVAERHPRLGAVVVEFHAGDRGLVHSYLWHWVGA
jgi:hypothetical protein